MKLTFPPLLQVFIVGLLMWAIARWMPGLTFDFPGRIVLAWIVGSVGVAMVLIAGLAFARAKTTVNPMKPENTSSLVTGGLYRISRNPMYLAMALLFVGWGLYFGNPISAALILGWVFFITEFQIKPEEKALQEKFGAEYDAYCQRVRRWI